MMCYTGADAVVLSSQGVQLVSASAVTVMIGEDPYILGLFDTTGTHKSRAQLFLSHQYVPQARRSTIVSVRCRTHKQTSS